MLHTSPTHSAEHAELVALREEKSILMARYLDLQRRHEDMLGRLVVTEAARDQAVAASNQNYAALQKERYELNDHPDARLLRHQLHTALQALAVAEEFSPSHANIMRAAQ